MVETLQGAAIIRMASIGRAENIGSASARHEKYRAEQAELVLQIGGDRIWRPMTVAAKPGAYLSTVAIMRSATSSR